MSVRVPPCRPCVQSVDAVCTSAALAAVLRPGILLAYCNDNFLVVYPTSAPGFAANWDDVMSPQLGKQPLGTSNAGDACQAGSGSLFSPERARPLKFSLFPPLLPSSNRSNNINNITFPGGRGTNMSDPAQPSYLSGINGAYGLPSQGPIGMTISGQAIYPVFGSNGAIALEVCSVDSCNEQIIPGVAQPVLRGDPFAYFGDNASCLYSAANYSADTTMHPPLIGWALDGPAIWGRYLHTTSAGFSTPLDACGGHQHGSFEYHYHAQVFTATWDADGQPGSTALIGSQYPAFTAGPFQCWRGNASAIDDFWNVNASSTCILLALGGRREVGGGDMPCSVCRRK